MRASASKTGLLTNCQWWARPDATHDNTPPGPAAERGTRFHAAMDLYVQTGVRVTVSEDIGAEYEHACRWVDAFGREALLPELALAWWPQADLAVQLPRVEGRDYMAALGSKERREAALFGTADLVSVDYEARAAVVADWKTGDASNAGPQLRTLALMVARAMGLRAVTVMALEVSSSGVREVCREELDGFALDAHAGELAEAIAAIPEAQPAPGSHCGEMYCPARVACPATQAAAAELVPVDALVRHRFGTTIASPEHAVWMLDRIRLVKAACEEIKKAIRAAVPEGGWELADGSRLVESTRKMPRFDTDVATALLKQLGATEAQIAACTPIKVEPAGLRVVGGDKPKRAPRKKAAA